MVAGQIPIYVQIRLEHRDLRLPSSHTAFPGLPCCLDTSTKSISNSFDLHHLRSSYGSEFAIQKFILPRINSKNDCTHPALSRFGSASRNSCTYHSQLDFYVGLSASSYVMTSRSRHGLPRRRTQQPIEC